MRAPDNARTLPVEGYLLKSVYAVLPLWDYSINNHFYIASKKSHRLPYYISCPNVNHPISIVRSGAQTQLKQTLCLVANNALAGRSRDRNQLGCCQKP